MTVENKSEPPAHRKAETASVARYNCPVELALLQLGGKWKVVLLACLKAGPHRYTELRMRTPGLSDKVRGERLRELVASGLVVQTKRGGRGAPSAYHLSERAAELIPVLDALYAWGLREAERVGASFVAPAPRPRRAQRASTTAGR